VPEIDGIVESWSPCCQKLSRIPQWMVAYAIAETGGKLRVQCGRGQTDQLRPVDPDARKGCGQWYIVDVREL
jgi:hypothetical protein